MFKIFIDGHSGTTGLKINGYLTERPEFEVLEIDPARRKDTDAKQALIDAADLVVLCLPDDAAIETVAMTSEARILDASTAHRTHPDWVYGLAELRPGQREAIRDARLVANPGCYPTGFLLAVRPLIDNGILKPETVLTISALSGYTGGGRQMIERYEARAAMRPDELWYSRPYALELNHKHVPEMQHYAGLQSAPLFLPSVGHFPQGMLVNIPLDRSWLTRDVTAEAIAASLQEAYADEPCVRVHPAHAEQQLEFGQLEPQANNYTNRVDLFVFGNESQFLVTARLDNLGKGAAGAAVQNINIMLGLPELTGLTAHGV